MSATDEERIIAVAEAMMRQSRRAGGVVDAVTHSYVEMPLRLGGSVGNGCETGQTLAGWPYWRDCFSRGMGLI
jgi:hypothetical protein